MEHSDHTEHHTVKPSDIDHKSTKGSINKKIQLDTPISCPQLLERNFSHFRHAVSPKGGRTGGLCALPSTGNHGFVTTKNRSIGSVLI